MSKPRKSPYPKPRKPSVPPVSFLDGRVVMYPGDCLDVLAAMPENSVDSVVCDPPYHLTSIVKRFGAEGAAEAKAGASGAYKRASAGFMGKQWDGGDIAFQPDTWRAVLRVLKPGGYIIAFASSRGFGRMSVAIEDAGFINHPMFGWIFGSGFPKATRIKAEGYEGFRYGGQASKPALEPIYMGQKPFSEATGTANILRWGTGAVNIDGCRVGDRWPANIIHDGSEAAVSGFPQTGPGFWSGETVGFTSEERKSDQHPRVGDDEGSAARYFYTAKADSEDRIGSKHPTVKPLDLVQYLVRYVTPPGGIVLDCFAGTGTTGEAAFREGMRAILIEREAEYQADIARRMELAENPTKRAAVAKSKNNLQGAEGTPLFGGDPATPPIGKASLRPLRSGRTIGPIGLKR